MKKNTLARRQYGVVLHGCSGRETVWFRSRPQADRARKAVRTHKAAGQFSGSETLTAVAIEAARRSHG